MYGPLKPASSVTSLTSPYGSTCHSVWKRSVSTRPMTNEGTPATSEPDSDNRPPQPDERLTAAIAPTVTPPAKLSTRPLRAGSTAHGIADMITWPTDTPL